MVAEANKLNLTYKVGSKDILVSKYCDIKRWITDNPGFDDKLLMLFKHGQNI
jgi:hypothetical protein